MTTIITPAPATAAAETTVERSTSSLRISPFRHTGSLPTAAFEQTFAEQLSHHHQAALPAGQPRRAAVTVLVTALRSGNPLSQVLTIARGLTAAELAASYELVDGLRCKSIAAWDELVADPTVARFDQVSARLERLFPALGSAFRSVAHDSQLLAERVAASSRHGDRVARDVAEIEAQLDDDEARGHALLGLLDNGQDAGMYHESVYRPKRVGDIVPSRLASLLALKESEDV